MVDKAITIQISGEATIIDSALDAFVRQNGWHDTVNGEPNPVTQIDKAEEVLRGFFSSTVAAWNINAAAEAARQEAAEATATALDETTMTVTVV